MRRNRLALNKKSIKYLCFYDKQRVQVAFEFLGQFEFSGHKINTQIGHIMDLNSFKVYKNEMFTYINYIHSVSFLGAYYKCALESCLTTEC